MYILFQFELLLHCRKQQTRIECVKLYVFFQIATRMEVSNNQRVIWVGNLIFEIKIINKKKNGTQINNFYCIHTMCPPEAITEKKPRNK